MRTVDLAGVCPLTTDAALRRAAAVVPDVEAVVNADERVTYAELAAEVARLRSALHHAGIGRGDHVGLCLGNGPRWVALFLAITSLGAVTVPVNTRFKQSELDYALRQSDVRLLLLADRVLSSDFVSMLREICPAVETRLPDPALPELRQVVVLGTEVPAGAQSWAEFTARAGKPVEPCSTPDDVALIQYTSGTTSFPKGVLLTHRNMCADAFFSGTRLGLRAGDRFYSGRPFFHVAGTTLSILACLQQLSTLVTAERFTPGNALRLLSDERCTHFAGNDTIALMMLNHPDRDRYPLVLRGAWLAASPTVVRRVIDELGATEAVVGYGLSEASPNVAQSAWWEPEELRVDASMPPEPGVEVRIRETGEGQPGEILVRGWNVMRGYYAMPEQTAAAIDAEGWLSTGDLGVLRPDGRLVFRGRAKELIRVGGENVAPTEVEAVLHRHPAIRQAAVVGVPDARLVEVPFAFVVLNEGATTSADELLGWCRDEMAGFKVPRHLRIVEGFEGIGMTASAKIRKTQLAEHAVGLLESSR
ncbi:AMP-binding protein [Amycolatopsis jiangsuensis]|uniref:Fatty-acyl-CoA synthase n=1 Tax=Amycolatopsis jiangsuensis TaxID=1181879 RepID=A0A840IQK3_9PSEU|nr:AMP-binding protein [Amycolatopsis jiangsuensis]MBB4684103.1 fatty-acyl-CoA synthase [Amycolatopsis jiangsuensis]